MCNRSLSLAADNRRTWLGMTVSCDGSKTWSDGTAVEEDEDFMFFRQDETGDWCFRGMHKDPSPYLVKAIALPCDSREKRHPALCQVPCGNGESECGSMRRPKSMIFSISGTVRGRLPHDFLEYYLYPGI